MRSSCEGAALWRLFFFFLPQMEFLQWKLVHWSVLVWNYHPFSVSCQCSVSQCKWGERDREVPALWNPCNARQLWRKHTETRAQAPALWLITWTIPGWAVRPTHLHEHPQGQMRQQSRNSCLLEEFRRNLATKSKLLNSSTLVVSEMRTVLSTLLIGAVYQIELSAASRVGPAHYECPASTILVKILYAAVDSQVC